MNKNKDEYEDWVSSKPYRDAPPVRKGRRNKSKLCADGSHKTCNPIHTGCQCPCHNDPFDVEAALQEALELEVKPWRFRVKNIKHRVKAKFCLCCGKENLQVSPNGFTMICKSCGCWYRLPGEIE